MEKLAICTYEWINLSNCNTAIVHGAGFRKSFPQCPRPNKYPECLSIHTTMGKQKDQDHRGYELTKSLDRMLRD